MAAERRGRAHRDHAHDAAFGTTEVTGMRPAISLTAAAEDLRHSSAGMIEGFKLASPPPCSAGRTGWWCCRSSWWRAAYSAPSSMEHDGRAEPGSCGYRCQLRANGWQSCGAGHGR
jgi:hypothetical protein